MKKILLLSAASLLCVSWPHAASGAPASMDAYLKNPAQGNLALKSVGPISFGPAGLLLIAEPV